MTALLATASLALLLGGLRYETLRGDLLGLSLTAAVFAYLI